MLKISDKKPIRSQAKKIAANVLKCLVGKEEAKINALSMQRKRQKFTGTSTRTLSHIKAEPRNDKSLTSDNEMYGIKKILPTL